ncbi:molybdate ABC transporter substrate-binding protein [Pseudaestuariivita sp.]|uniref:molybdate ABC transporter substrate-binding protein n=1 Tax=Pseudaestuariivita sp. TaxID=2211669 RepID=UPI004059B28F
MRMWLRRLICVLWALGAAPGGLAASDTPLDVYAAASLGEAVAALAPLWRAETGQELRAVHAGTATLARQIAAGAPAEVFLSADAAWMDWSVSQGVVAEGSDRVFARNSLVVIAPAAAAEPLALTSADLTDRLGSGRMAMGLPDAVPAGTYAREALISLGLWPLLEDRIAGTDSVRAALALVALGAAPLGIVYATDLRAEPRVRKVADIPVQSHAPITYHAAPVLRGDQSDAAGAFVAFLATAPAQDALQELGFGAP